MDADYRFQFMSRGQKMVAKALSTINKESHESVTPLTGGIHLTIQGTDITEVEKLKTPDLTCNEDPNDFDLETVGADVPKEVTSELNTDTETPEVDPINTVVEESVTPRGSTDNLLEDSSHLSEPDDDRDLDWFPPSEEDTNSDVEIPENVDHEEVVEQPEPVPKRKKSNPDLWKKNTQKRNRMHGKKYIGAKKTAEGKYEFCCERGERLLTPRGCSKACDNGSNWRQCRLLDDNDRKNIFDDFWEHMSWDQKKVFVASLIDRKAPKRTNADDASVHKKLYTYEYHLKKNDVRIRVCKNMFLSTLGIGEKTIYAWAGTSSNGMPTPNKKAMSQAENDKHKTVVEFLDAIPKLPSHYCRASSSKTYLEPTFSTFAELYRVFVDHAHAQGIENIAGTKLFQTVLNEKNISLYKPKKDLCDTCCMHESGNLSDEAYQEHINRKDSARAEVLSSDNTIKVVTMDLQSLLLSPKLQASSMYYKTKLSCHNFTIHDMQTKDVTCYFWNESEGDLTANSFASFISDYIEHLPENVTEVILFSDGCTNQNRNCVLSNALLKLAFQRKITIFQKYLERGHTQMECDSVHSTIERKIRNRRIYCPQNYVDFISDARHSQPYAVKYVSHEFFHDYSALSYYSSIRPGVRVGEAVVTDIRSLVYLPSGEIKYKLNFGDGEFSEFPRKCRTRVPTMDDTVQQLHSARLPIKSSKYNHLQQLKSVIPKDYHPYYDGLPHQ